MHTQSCLISLLQVNLAAYYKELHRAWNTDHVPQVCSVQRTGLTKQKAPDWRWPCAGEGERGHVKSRVKEINT